MNKQKHMQPTETHVGSANHGMFNSLQVDETHVLYGALSLTPALQGPPPTRPPPTHTTHAHFHNSFSCRRAFLNCGYHVNSFTHTLARFP